MATKKHQDFLNSHCRVRSRALGKIRYRTTKYQLLLEYWGVDPTSNIADVHPQFFCNSCYLTSKKISGSKDRGVGHHTTISNVTFVILFVIGVGTGGAGGAIAPHKFEAGGTQPPQLRSPLKHVIYNSACRATC